MSTMDDKKWKASMDAETLAEAQRIASDKKRLAAAQKEAKMTANEFAKAAGAKGGKSVAGAVQLKTD